MKCMSKGNKRVVKMNVSNGKTNADLMVHVHNAYLQSKVEKRSSQFSHSAG